MKTIQLTEEHAAIVDDCDYARLSARKWFFHQHGYAYVRTRGKMIYMHQEILPAPKGMEVDHKNRNTLDNRRRNLRLATHAQNQQNSVLKSFSTTKIKGVSFEKGYGYRARITVDKKTIYLGYFKDSEAASNAYKKAAKKYFGEFARLA